ncbi:MAG: hypothetical protein RLZZ15_4547, partial [Verrucomicrobiota bacterium]
LKQLLHDVKSYIESTEVSNDGEWGSSRSLAELIEAKAMPEIYARVLAALANE